MKAKILQWLQQSPSMKEKIIATPILFIGIILIIVISSK
jgi:hypothetical protein